MPTFPEAPPSKPTHRPSEAMIKAEQEGQRRAIENVANKGRPPQIFEARCHVCTSPHRNFIEGLLIKGANYVWVSENVPGIEDKKIDRRSVANHAKKHMQYKDAAIRAILEEEAEMASQNYEEGVRGAITHRGVLEVALRKAYEDIIAGVTTVEARDMISLINTLQKMDEQREQVAVNELRAQVQAFVEAIKHETNQETWARIFKRFKALLADDDIDVDESDTDQFVEVIDAPALPPG